MVVDVGWKGRKEGIGSATPSGTNYLVFTLSLLICSTSWDIAIRFWDNTPIVES
ncbi:hypothetical protein GCM10025794_37060 [Massilia kyonggiensis]